MNPGPRPTAAVPGSVLFVALVAAACSQPPAPSPTEAHATPTTNRIDVPESVRKNLGITFAKVERRHVAATLRLPGHFEPLPQARTELRAPAAGRVSLRVQPLQAVAKGDVLCALDAPDWRSLQQQLAEVDTEAGVTQAHLAAIQPLLDAHQDHERSLQEALAVMQERVRGLTATNQSVGGQAQPLTDARVQLAQVQAQIAEAAEQHTDTQSRIARLEADRKALVGRRSSLLAQAAVLHGTTPEALLAPGKDGPRWRELGAIELRASAPGAVESLPLADGAWVEAHELVVATLDANLVRFRAQALQGDLGRLRDGLPCRLVPAGTVQPEVVANGPLQLGLAADPVRRTLDVFVVPSAPAAFARPGVAGFVEITTQAGGSPTELAIPRQSLQQDGLRRVYFRRDPKDRDKVIRVEADDLGIDDGRWIEVKSGLVDGDEVVLHGVYELMLASSGSAQKGGHFHADGTWHADDHK
ncbi:MAG: hypothetical protein JNK15_02030 [Planctomycetes bacterium]|nr:hypothetical protein [Planctomycetota bacterium]